MYISMIQEYISEDIFSRTPITSRNSRKLDIIRYLVVHFLWDNDVIANSGNTRVLENGY